MYIRLGTSAEKSKNIAQQYLVEKKRAALVAGSGVMYVLFFLSRWTTRSEVRIAKSG